MNTDRLIAMLATGEGRTIPFRPERRLAVAAAAGALCAIPVMLVMLGLNPDLAAAARTPMFWVRFAFVAILVVGAGRLAVRLARPGVRLARTPLLVATPLVLIWLLAAVTLAVTAPEGRPELIWGATWTSCAYNILLLSIPAMVAALWTLRSMTPTRLRLAGGAAGLLAGAVGALVYTLHCPELTAPFLGIWYVLGMLAPALLGVVLGPRVLRW
jgi:hypothetical protein